MWDDLLSGITDLVYSTARIIAKWSGAHGATIAVILFGTYALRKFGTDVIMRIIRHTLREDLFPTKSDREKRINTLKSLISTSMKMVSWIIAFLLIADNLNIKTTSLLASAGVFGLAIGFGAQSLIKDFVSGFFIIIENQYRVGDVVKLNEVSGAVEAITIRTTIIRDIDGHVHHIPNGSITGTMNKTMDFGQLNIDLLVDHETDIDLQEKVINKTGIDLSKLKDHEKYVLKEPHFVNIKEITTNGILVKILGKTTPNKQWEIRGEFYRMLINNLRKNKITLPKTEISISK